MEKTFRERAKELVKQMADIISTEGRAKYNMQQPVPSILLCIPVRVSKFVSQI